MSIVASKPLAAGVPAEQILEQLAARFAAVRDPRDRWGLTVVVAGGRLRDCLRWLRDEPTLAFDQLIDVAGADYLAYPGHRGPRFAVVYILKSTCFRHRCTVKVEVEEDACAVPSVHDLWRSAAWAERETWDQYGIVFQGHPNLKRLLNHHEFSGHPLRKDYPCQKRQKLSVNDPMIDQLEARLRARGYEIVERGEVGGGEPLTFREGAR
jgi:NADH:ubiquinone oxidoreductase subunit C